MTDGSTEIAVEYDEDEPPPPIVTYTWRTSRPINRDAVCLQIFKYEWSRNFRKSSILLLDSAGEPYWQEYGEFAIIPDSTVELDGLDLMYLLGPNSQVRDTLPDFDPRRILEEKIDTKVRSVIETLMKLEPAVEFDDG